MTSSPPRRRRGLLAAGAATTVVALSLALAGGPAVAEPIYWPSKLTVGGAQNVSGIAIHDYLLYAADSQGRITSTTPDGETKPLITIERADATPLAVAVNSSGDIAFSLASRPYVYEVPANQLPATFEYANDDIDARKIASLEEGDLIYGLAFDDDDNLYFGGAATENIYKLASGSTTPSIAITDLDTPPIGMGVAPDRALYFSTGNGTVRQASQEQLRGGLPISGSDTEEVTKADPAIGIAFTGYGLQHYISRGEGGTVTLEDFSEPYTPGTVAVSGTPVVGETLEAELSGWPDGSQYTYQWNRNGSPINGATSSTLLLTEDDLTATLSVSVTGSVDEKTAPAVTSDEVGPVEESTAPAAPLFDGRSDVTVPLTATAGEPLNFTNLGASGRPVPSYDVTTETGGNAVLPEGVIFREGILSGTATVAGEYRFLVTATNSEGQAREHIVLTVAPGAATGISALVAPGTTDPAQSDTLWSVGTDGSVFKPGVDGFVEQGVTITAIQGSTIAVSTTLADRYGNRVPADAAATLTSSIDTDSITYGNDGLAFVTFNHASPHVITIRQDGVVNSFTAEVSPLATTPETPAATPSGAAPVSALAATGANQPAPFALAVALVFGGGLLVLWTRTRERRPRRRR